MNELIVVDRPTSAFSEAIKTVCTNLKFSSINKKVKTVMITSSVPGEGKSFISANLAAAFTQLGEKVLLIDCDLRRGRQAKLFGIKSSKLLGMSNLLIDDEYATTSKKYVKKTSVENLFLLPAGTFPPNPSELLSSDRCDKVLKHLKKYFDVIILDCPPVTGLNDALVVSNYADVSIIVTQHKKTPMELLEKSKKSLEKVGAKLAGVILNQIDSKNKSYYYSYYSEDK